MNIIDLFCGVGGLSYGFKEKNYQIVAAVDHWNDALLTYKYNFPKTEIFNTDIVCLLYTSPSPRDATLSRMPSSA